MGHLEVIMQVAELRRRLAEKIQQAATGGDEETIATMLEYGRAVLITLSQHLDDAEVTLQDLFVGTKTAALILGLHPEHVRFLVRQGRLDATKENGGIRITLSDLMNYMNRATKFGLMNFDPTTFLGNMQVLWHKPGEEAAD